MKKNIAFLFLVISVTVVCGGLTGCFHLIAALLLSDTGDTSQKASYNQEEEERLINSEVARQQWLLDFTQRQREEEREQQQREEAARLAREEANRYDPANFIIVPKTFYPTKYSKADLFAAVAASERLETVSVIPANGFVFSPSRDFVSDVVFVSQNGTDITFRTADNAISKSMKVGSRTGLTVGQRVRIYYTVYRIKDWTIDAIERL
jgi:hypothetical protein